MDQFSQQQKIPVVVSFDQNYAPYAKAMFRSLWKHLSDHAFCEIIILHKDLSSSAKTDLLDFAAQEAKGSIRFLQISKEQIDKHHFYVSDKPNLAYIPETAYLRLFIPDVLPEYDRVVYMDVDMIVQGDIQELYNIEMGNNYLAAIPDSGDHQEYAEKILGVPSGRPYFNSGVLVMNLLQLRQDRMTDKFMKIFHQLGTPMFHDQDVLNAACSAKTIFLDISWNFQLFNLFPKSDPSALKTPVRVIHYIGPEKPWKHPQEDNAKIWWKFYNPSKNDETKTMRHPANSSDFSKELENAIYPVWPIHGEFSDLFREYLRKNPDAVEHLCKMLYDDTSRETVRLGITRILAHPPREYSGAFFYQPGKLMTEEEKSDWVHHTALFGQYNAAFHNLFTSYEPPEFYYRHGMIWMSEPFLNRLKGGIFFDCGAFNGASSLVMSLYQPSQIYAFEPSKHNFLQTIENLKRAKIQTTCCLINSCVGNDDGAINFSDNGGADAKNGGSDQVPVCRLDTFVTDKKIPRVDWIKADLEGFAMEMIRGAEQTVKRWKPLLTIGVYHCPDEFFAIVQLLKKWVPEYQFMYRRCQCHPVHFYNEITLIAWVPAPGEGQQGIKNINQ